MAGLGPFVRKLLSIDCLFLLFGGFVTTRKAVIATTIETLDLAEWFLVGLSILLLLTLRYKISFGLGLLGLDALWAIPGSMIQSIT